MIISVVERVHDREKSFNTPGQPPTKAGGAPPPPDYTLLLTSWYPIMPPECSSGVSGGMPPIRAACGTC